MKKLIAIGIIIALLATMLMAVPAGAAGDTTILPIHADEGGMRVNGTIRAIGTGDRWNHTLRVDASVSTSWYTISTSVAAGVALYDLWGTAYMDTDSKTIRFRGSTTLLAAMGDGDGIGPCLYGSVIVKLKSITMGTLVGVWAVDYNTHPPTITYRQDLVTYIMLLDIIAGLVTLANWILPG